MLELTVSHNLKL